MIQDHPSFDCPEDEAIIWRYMDLAKFMSLLETRKLYFSRADLLGDPFEYARPRKSIEQGIKANEEWRQQAIAEIEAKPPSEMKAKILQAIEERYASMKEPLSSGYANPDIRQSLYVSCWHINAFESAAMWKLYLKSDEGIAIKTTVGAFKKSLSGYRMIRALGPRTEEIPIFIGRVKYIDYENDFISSNNTLNYIMHKRLSFAHEHELRAVIWYMDLIWDKVKQCGRLSDTPPAFGMSVDVDLTQLVERVYVAPSMQLWFVELIRSILARYGLSVPVIRSNLFDPPL